MPLLKSSLRLKLTLWFLAIFTVVFGGVASGAWLLHRQSIRRVLDDRLETFAGGVTEALRGGEGTLRADGLWPFQPIDRTFVILAVRDADGEVLASWTPVDVTALPPLPNGTQDVRAAIHPISGETAQRLLGRPVTTRMLTYRYMMSDGSVRYVDLARTIDMKMEEQLFLNDVFLIGAFGALLASGMAAWLVAGRAVVPMRQLTVAAAHVDPQHIGERLLIQGDEVEVENVRSALNEALARLEEGYRAQERFISNVAHDLKTPIAVMLTESQVLRPGSVSLEEFEAYRNSVIAEMQRLGGLVESFLTLARADQGEALARMVEVPVLDVVLEAVSECDPQAEQADVRLVVVVDDGDPDDELTLRGDPDLVRTMLGNIIRNAIRFSPPGEAVQISVSGSGPDQAEISVRDRGPGVPEGSSDRLFDRFVQAEPNPARRDGTGLGLAIAKSVATMHGGAIEVHNCADRGCIFTVTLPRVP